VADYRRYRVAGGTYFFTVNLLQRYPNDLLVRHIELLRTVVREVRKNRPFHIDAWVILPDHLHCVWTLPPGDDDFTNRWRMIKQRFSKALPMTECRSSVRIARGERGLWQRRFWEHAIRDDGDYAATSIIVTQSAQTWLYQTGCGLAVSTFHRYVERGVYPLDWADGPESDLKAGEHA
jgi:REP-associated tyrosine transposase